MKEKGFGFCEGGEIVEIDHTPVTDPTETVVDLTVLYDADEVILTASVDPFVTVLVEVENAPPLTDVSAPFVASTLTEMPLPNQEIVVSLAG